MAGYFDYYSTIARAISDLPGKTEEARGAVYELARTAYQKSLSAFDPPISKTDLVIERFALEAAIQRVETESRSSDTEHDLSFISAVIQIVYSVRDRLNRSITVRGDSLRPAITAGLAQGLVFFQRLTAKNVGPRIFNILGDRWRILKNPQIRIAVGPIVAALVTIFVAAFVHWMTAEDSRESKSSYSLISPSELALSDVTLNHPSPDSHSAGVWEVKGAIMNNSPRTLTGLWLKITVRDCPNDSACATIGEEIKHIVINCPSSQKRIIDEGLFSSEMFIPKELKWSYEIVETDAK
jgi:hypothetical protein